MRKQGALAGPVAADEADFDVVDDGRLGVVEQDLVAVTLVRIFDLQQNRHRQNISQLDGRIDVARGATNGSPGFAAFRVE